MMAASRFSLPQRPSMTLRFLCATFAAACLMAACGGDVPPQTTASTRLLAASASSAAAPLGFPGLRADYSITETANGYLVAEVSGSGATAVPRNARLRFTDISVALDIDGVAGRAFRLYRAAFDRVPDAPGISYWIGLMDRGVDPAVAAGAFMESSEFKARYGNGLSDADYVGKLYRNVLHRDGDPAGMAFWTGLLARGASTRAQVLAAFSEGAEGKAAVRDAIRTGIYFLEDGVAYLPAADAGPNRIVDLGRLVTFDGGASTVTIGKPILYYWTFGKKPAGSNAVLGDAGSAHPSFVPDLEGEYEVKLVVSDGIDYSREVRISVAAAWAPDVGRMPASGNLVYFESENGDPLGRGINTAFTQANAVLNITADHARISVNVQGDNSLWGTLALPTKLGRLVPGYYGGLSTDTWSDKGGVEWWGFFGSCSGSGSSWLVIDSVAYDGDTLVAVDLRFSQRCANSSGALHGRVRWSQDDLTRPPGPVNPAPAGLWQAAPGTTPAAGNYVYLESVAGDYIGGGQRLTFTDATSSLRVGVSGAQASVSINGPSWWSGDFAGMRGLSRLEPGYYGKLQRYPFHNPAKGGLDWGGDGRGCNTLTGWFVVDKVTYVDNAVTELDLRFEQHCDGMAAALNGQIHWRAPAQTATGQLR
jgi:hypothetical protein